MPIFFSNYFSSVYSSELTVLDVNKLNTSSYDLPNNAAFSIDDVLCSLSS